MFLALVSLIGAQEDTPATDDNSTEPDVEVTEPAYVIIESEPVNVSTNEITEADLDRLWGAGADTVNLNDSGGEAVDEIVETAGEEDTNVSRQQFIPWGDDGSEVSTTTSTTLQELCGGRNDICIVEFDSNGDGRPECCGVENSTVCSQCIDYCREHCGGRSLRVNTCFIDGNSNPFCQCSPGAPTCYAPDPGQTTTTQAVQEESGSGNMLVYAALFGLILVLVAAAHRFAERLM